MMANPVTSHDNNPILPDGVVRSEGRVRKDKLTAEKKLKFTAMGPEPDEGGVIDMRHASATGFVWPGYAFWPMGLMLALFSIGAYVSNLTFPLIATLGGLLCFGFWRYAAAFRMPLLALTALLVWGAINTDAQALVAAFASVDAFSKTQWAKTAAQLICLPPLILAAWRMPGRDAHRLMRGLQWVMAALAVLVLCESVTGAALYQWISLRIYQPIRPDLALVKTSLTTYQLVWVLWPLAMLSARGGNKAIVWLIGAAVLVAPVVMSANAVSLALAGSVMVFLAAKYWPKTWDGPEHVMAMIFAALIMLFPGLMAILSGLGIVEAARHHLPASWAARVTIWESAATKMFEWPLTGFGFDYSRNFSGVPLHPHNAAIQTGLELGFVGLILMALFWAMAILRIGKPERLASEAQPATDEVLNDAEAPDTGELTAFAEVSRIDTRPYMLAALVPYLVFAFMSFGMWQEWFVAMGAIMVTVCLLACRSVEYETERWRLTSLNR